jgi:hypothetical protein
MKPIRQKVHFVDPTHNQVMVISGKGNIYPVELNHFVKEIKPGDTAIVVKSFTGEWLLVDVEPKYPFSNPLDVTQFPRDKHNNLDILGYWHYRAEFDELKSDRERNKMNVFLIKLFKEKYGYDALRNVEPKVQASLEEY